MVSSVSLGKGEFSVLISAETKNGGPAIVRSLSRTCKRQNMASKHRFPTVAFLLERESFRLNICLIQK